MKVVILGKGSMLANLIEGLRVAGIDIAAVYRHERTTCSWLHLKLKDLFKSSPEYTLIKNYKLKEITCRSANSENFKREILKLNADIILVGTWKEKLEKEIIDLPKIATINVHPSLLPKYRGPNPYIQTILNGEKSSGITFHLISEKFDEGAILVQKEIEILPSYTSKELKEKTVFQARVLVAEVLNKVCHGMIEPLAQDESQASYYTNISGDEKMLDFINMSSTQIINTVRALYPYLPAYITCKCGFLIVNPYKMRLINKFGRPGEIIQKSYSKSSLAICCADGRALEMWGLKLYKFPLLTRLFIKYLV